MSAIPPPPSRVWWKQPLDRVEGTWIVIAFVWCLVMFFMMPYWHVFGKQNLVQRGLSHDARDVHRQDAGDGRQVQGARRRPTRRSRWCIRRAGSDVYLIARLWQWWPILELEEGKTYRLHLSSMD